MDKPMKNISRAMRVAVMLLTMTAAQSLADEQALLIVYGDEGAGNTENPYGKQLRLLFCYIKKQTKATSHTSNKCGG